MPAPDLNATIAALVTRWGQEPEVLAQRLVGELRCAGLLIVPAKPTGAMVHASCVALRRHGVKGYITHQSKHRLRLQDALAAGAIEVAIDQARERG